MTGVPHAVISGEVASALRSDRPKHLAVCRESDSRGPLDCIAARSQNDDKRDLAYASTRWEVAVRLNASVTSTDVFSQQTYGPGETDQKSTRKLHQRLQPRVAIQHRLRHPQRLAVVVDIKALVRVPLLGQH